MNPAALFPNSLGYSFLLPVKGAQRQERMSVPKATGLLGISIHSDFPRGRTLGLRAGAELLLGFAETRSGGLAAEAPEPGPAAWSQER